MIGAIKNLLRGGKGRTTGFFANTMGGGRSGGLGSMLFGSRGAMGTGPTIGGRVKQAAFNLPGIGPAGQSLAASSVTPVGGALGRAVEHSGAAMNVGRVRQLRMPGVLNYRTLAGAGLGFGGSKAIEAYQGTIDYQEMTGAQKTGLGLLNMYSKFHGYKSLAKGAVGTGMRGAGQIFHGNVGAYQRQYNWAARGLGSNIPLVDLANRKTLAGMGVRAAGKAAGFIPRQTLRFGVGLIHAGVATTRMGVGGAGGVVRSLTMGRAGWGAGSWRNAMHPKPLGGVGQKIFGGQKSMAMSKTFGMAHEAPMMSGFMAMGAAGGYMHAKAKYGRENASWDLTAMSLGVNPQNYGKGVHTMRRGQARNYGPSLTLQLHQNHTRRMPH